jgi:hypothetical protein
MPTFDPSKPAAISLISSGELRDQLSDLSSDVLPQMTAAGSLTPTPNDSTCPPPKNRDK